MKSVALRDYLLTALISLSICVVIVGLTLLSCYSKPRPFSYSYSVSIPTPVEDLTSRQTHCHLHGLKLQRQIIPAEKLADNPFKPSERQIQESFPYSSGWPILNSCGSGEKQTAVSHCSECCELRKLWVTEQIRKNRPASAPSNHVAAISLYTKPGEPDFEFEGDHEEIKMSFDAAPFSMEP